MHGAESLFVLCAVHHYSRVIQQQATFPDSQTNALHGDRLGSLHHNGSTAVPECCPWGQCSCTWRMFGQHSCFLLRTVTLLQSHCCRSKRSTHWAHASAACTLRVKSGCELSRLLRHTNTTGANLLQTGCWRGRIIGGYAPDCTAPVPCHSLLTLGPAAGHIS